MQNFCEQQWITTYLNDFVISRSFIEVENSVVSDPEVSC